MDLTIRKILWVNIRKISEWTKECQNPVFLNIEILLVVAPKYIIQRIFWKDQIRSDAFKYLALNWDWHFGVSSRKYIKWAIFDILMTMTLAVNITRRMAPFFSSTLWVLPVNIFQFWISKFYFHFREVPTFQ